MKEHMLTITDQCLESHVSLRSYSGNKTYFISNWYCRKKFLAELKLEYKVESL